MDQQFQVVSAWSVYPYPIRLCHTVAHTAAVPCPRTCHQCVPHLCWCVSGGQHYGSHPPPSSPWRAPGLLRS